LFLHAFFLKAIVLHADLTFCPTVLG
jgi:hypothetical protein